MEAKGHPQETKGSQSLLSTTVYPDLCSEFWLPPNSVLVSYCCFDRLTQTWVLRKTEMYSLTIQEV